MDFEGKIALVTGASRGIGRAIAEDLGKHGAFVIGTATSDNGAEHISAALRDADMKGVGMTLDVTSDEAVTEVLKQIQDKHGAPTILVNNAGITKDNILMRMKTDEWSSVIDTNLNAIFRLSKACVRGMYKARWGRIVNIGSVVGAMGNIGQVNYATTKAGVEGFTRSLAKELGGRNITVNTVAPGFIDTDMTKALPDASREAIMSHIALGRLGQPEEIAAAVTFLSSSAGAYITGETIHINGGLYMG